MVTLATSIPIETLRLLTKDYDSPQSPQSSVRSDNGYQFSYSTDDQSRDEHAVIVVHSDGGKAVEIFDVSGTYSFIGDDNRRYTVEYTAGINGYRANLVISDVTPPPVYHIDPNALKSLVG
ncbi:uncharacterized protein LOC132259085 [Phlebotomus argentipes]|uniref:uncharacterized protein LOC132259085 n=1 Tax=Phlebotomus argentipes TaxID=94469 RepID=UPI002892DEB7|nr:uncharacterized protein LOC132259085 [Phlebotomus argentipes]